MKRIRVYSFGFTLIEMLVVLFIIGIILSIVIPAQGPIMDTLKLNTAAENLANTLIAARQYALTNGKDGCVVFPTTGSWAYNAYSLYDLNQDMPIGKIEVLPSGISIEPYNTADESGSYFMGESVNIFFDGSNVDAGYIRFQPSGNADRTGNIYVLNTSTTDFRKIAISPSSGRVNLKNIGEDDE